MRSRSVAVSLILTLLCAGGAVGSYARAHSLRTEARWLLERGTAQAQEYADTFDGSAADSELGTLDQRQAVLDRAQLWYGAQLLLVLATVVLAFSSYVFYLFRRLRDQLLDATGMPVVLDPGKRTDGNQKVARA